MVIKRKRLRKRNKIKVRLKKEASCKSVTGPFRQNCTIQTSVCFDVEYLCKNISIALGRRIYPSDPLLTEQGIKDVLTKVRGNLSNYVTNELPDNFDFWEECIPILKLKRY